MSALRSVVVCWIIDDGERMNKTVTKVVQLSARNRADTSSTACKRSRRIGRCCQQRGSQTHPDGGCATSLRARERPRER
jgi:hypothetical protein